MQDREGEVIVKPCTQAEIVFYQDTLSRHHEFAAFMPTYMGTLALGDHTTEAIATASGQQRVSVQPQYVVKKIKTDVAIVLDNVEYGYIHPNVVDLKLGSRLYGPDTEPSKAARLDTVASETTSGSLNFRVAGMKVWDEQQARYNIFDKQYGRQFSAATVQEAFETFFATLQKHPQASSLLRSVLSDLTEICAVLEGSESRFYSASVLLVYEGDLAALNMLEHGLERQITVSIPQHETGEDTGSESEEDDEPLPPHKLKMIDFAHSSWLPGEGPDENVIRGLRNIEAQLKQLIAKHNPG